MSIDSQNRNQKNIGPGICLKLEKEPLRDYKSAFCSPLALTVHEKKIFKDW
jgi:hypothetical protein